VKIHKTVRGKNEKTRTIEETKRGGKYREKDNKEIKFFEDIEATTT
jgi:hypothetical protein